MIEEHGDAAWSSALLQSNTGSENALEEPKKYKAIRESILNWMKALPQDANTDP
jgi:hypothetical protein